MTWTCARVASTTAKRLTTSERRGRGRRRRLRLTKRCRASCRTSIRRCGLSIAPFASTKGGRAALAISLRVDDLAPNHAVQTGRRFDRESVHARRRLAGRRATEAVQVVLRSLGSEEAAGPPGTARYDLCDDVGRPETWAIFSAGRTPQPGDRQGRQCVRGRGRAGTSRTRPPLALGRRPHRCGQPADDNRPNGENTVARNTDPDTGVRAKTKPPTRSFACTRAATDVRQPVAMRGLHPR